MKPDISWCWQSRSAPATTPVPWVRVWPMSAGRSAAVAFETDWIFDGSVVSPAVTIVGSTAGVSSSVGGPEPELILKPYPFTPAGIVKEMSAVDASDIWVSNDID